MDTKKIELDFSKLYGFKILAGGARTPLGAKIGEGKITSPVGLVLGSKIGGGKII